MANSQDKVICIRKDDSGNDCRCISHIKTADGRVFTRDDAYWHVLSHPDSLHVDGAYLIAVTNNGTRYVRTTANDTEADNLLNLPRCQWI